MVNYHEDAQKLFDEAERFGRELAEQYSNGENVDMWINSAIRAKVNIMAREGLTVKELVK